MATEKRLIDANALMEETVWKCGGDPYDQYYMGYQDALDNVEVTIENQDTVDAVEVVHGRWEQDGIYNRCSVCHKLTMMPHLNGLARFSFCPNCGTKMDGDGNG